MTITSSHHIITCNGNDQDSDVCSESFWSLWDLWEQWDRGNVSIDCFITQVWARLRLGHIVWAREPRDMPVSLDLSISFHSPPKKNKWYPYQDSMIIMCVSLLLFLYFGGKIIGNPYLKPAPACGSSEPDGADKSNIHSMAHLDPWILWTWQHIMNFAVAVTNKNLKQQQVQHGAKLTHQ